MPTVTYKRPLGPEELLRNPGAYLGPPPEAAVADLSVPKIDAHLAQDPFEYVGPTGFDQKPDKHARVRQQISAGHAVEMPIMSSPSGSLGGVKVIDGRHRLYNLKMLGVLRVDVVVPASQLNLFLSAFG